MQKLAIIDTIGPFMEDVEGETINWSKIHFASLETKGRLLPTTHKKIVKCFEGYLRHIRHIGYNAVSIDDLAHMARLPFYGTSLSSLLDDYVHLYHDLFRAAKRHNLGIYVTTDYLFSHPEIEAYRQKTQLSPEDFFGEVLESVFLEFPQVDGVILRIGENDGKDITQGFLSELLLKTPQQANRLLHHVLPVFERFNKTLIFRTWTVGVYPIGDLIWNPKTFDEIFHSITSKSLIISMKYGDTDFMRELPLNPLFLHSNHQKIIELQTRREWEGMGVYPSFVGWDYADYHAQLAEAKGIVGIHVWCQTGGWASSRWNNITYGKGSSFWNELNTEVTLNIFQSNLSVENAIELFCQSRHIANPQSFIKLLQLSDVAIKKGLYLPEISKRPLYFRRSRLPTLLWLMWDTTLLHPFTLRLLRALVIRPDQAIKEADDACDAVRQMRMIAQELTLSPAVLHSLEFQLHTFSLFARIRRVMLGIATPHEVKRLNVDMVAYQKAFPQHYTLSPLSHENYGSLPRWILPFALRRSPKYRPWDYILLLTSPFQRWILLRILKRSDSRLIDQSMGIDVLFK